VFRDVYLKERLAVPWREILWALRRLEARGLVRGGHFVTGVTGEQFAEETTVPLLRASRRQPATADAASVAASR
jgi:ATP-dependent Lhr-like helicase